MIELSLDAQHWSSGVTLGIDQVPVTSETAIQVVTAELPEDDTGVVCSITGVKRCDSHL
ncbi:hypothetical protein [Sodalis glossinidius]|uniref:hypothetical protein n=1 Tax=Sodalis glossinidius TaxID=63612 RepID=UPI00030B16A3|nr:hypothetical protein [Sodalis glossinidius]